MRFWTVPAIASAIALVAWYALTAIGDVTRDQAGIEEKPEPHAPIMDVPTLSAEVGQ